MENEIVKHIMVLYKEMQPKVHDSVCICSEDVNICSVQIHH